MSSYMFLAPCRITKAQCPTWHFLLLFLQLMAWITNILSLGHPFHCICVKQLFALKDLHSYFLKKHDMSWVALSFKCCQSVCEGSVSPDQISTFLSDPGPIIVYPCQSLTDWLSDWLTNLLKLEWFDPSLLWMNWPLQTMQTIQTMQTMQTKQTKQTMQTIQTMRTMQTM